MVTQTIYLLSVLISRGGANSVRGWSVRELGPGSMEVDSTTSFALQSGDIRLDLNLEYRTKLFGSLNWRLT